MDYKPRAIQAPMKQITHDLIDKVAVVTGSTKGIGEGIAKAMALEGAKVIVNGRDVESGNRVVQEIREAGCEATFFKADLGEEVEVKALLHFAEETYGALHILVNNHAPTVEIMEEQVDSYLADTDTDGWDFLIKYGLTSCYYTMKHALPLMLKHGNGSIVNISSLAGEIGAHGMSMYSATKGGLQALTRNVATDYGKRGIRVNSIVVGAIISHHRMEVMFENSLVRDNAMKNLLVPRLGYPEDIAHMAVYFASDKSGYVNGQALRCDGGLTMHMPLADMQEGFTDLANELTGKSRSKDDRV